MNSSGRSLLLKRSGWLLRLRNIVQESPIKGQAMPYIPERVQYRSACSHFWMKGGSRHNLEGLLKATVATQNHLMGNGDKRGALDAYRRALAIHPFMDGLKQVVDRISPEIDGRDL